MTPYQAIISSSAVPIFKGDSLLIDLRFAIGTDTTFIVHATQLDEDGNLIDLPVSVASDITADNQRIRIRPTTGVITNVSVEAPTGNLTTGQLFAAIRINRGNVLNANNQITLTTGYITESAPLVFPLSPAESADQSFSQPTPIDVANPGVGLDYDGPIIGGQPGKIIGFICNFQADANAANRRIEFQFRPGGSTIWISKNRTNITANQLWVVLGWQGGNMPDDDTVNFRTYIALPNTLEASSFELRTVTTNIQAGDAFDSLQIMAARSLDL